MRGKDWRTIAAVTAVVLAVGYLVVSGLSKSGVYYWTVSEVIAGEAGSGNESVRISGDVVGGTINFNQQDILLTFAVRDSEDPGKIINAAYSGVMPDAFKEDIEVILEGVYDRGKNLFNASVLLAKCPSKYVEEGSSEPE